MTNTMPPSFYFGSSSIDAVRTALSERNWQDSPQTAYVERAAVIQLVIDWAQGRTEIPEQVAAVIDDSHIGSGSGGYSAPQRVNMIMDHLASKRDAGKLYTPVTAEGLKSLVEWLETQPVRETPSPVGEADETLEMHPNQRRYLVGLNRDERRAVSAHATFLGNISGGRRSENLSYAVNDIKRAGSPEALMAQDKADNDRLMGRAV
jgi:hypothetical protein